MQTLSVNDPKAVTAAADALLNNQVIAAPTETVYGLMARWNSQEAREQIYTLKHRPADKKLQMLLPNLEALTAYTLKNMDWIEAIGRTFWPGPLTLIVETLDGETIGARIPNQPFVIDVLKQLNEPIAATSANLSGTPAAFTPEAAVNHLNGQPALLVNAGTVTVTGGTASTVASIIGRKLTILRPGVISLEQLQEALSPLP